MQDTVMMMMVKQCAPHYSYSKLTLALSRSLQIAMTGPKHRFCEEEKKVLKVQNRGFHIIHTVPSTHRFLSDDDI